MAKKLFLLDGMALVYRAHFALIARPIFTSKGVNTSALFGFTDEIHSIRHALSLLGLRDLCRWVSLLTLAGMCEDKPPALIVNTMTRARYCELLALPLRMADRATDLFLMGLLSLVDTILDTPMSEILEQLTLSADVKAALTGQTGNQFHDVLCLVIAFSTTLWVLLPLAAFFGTTWSALMAASFAAWTAVIPASRRAEGLGYSGVAGTLAVAAAPTVGLFLYDLGWPWLAAGIVLCALALLGLMIWKLG